MSNYENRESNTENIISKIPDYTRKERFQIVSGKIFVEKNEEKTGKKMSLQIRTHKFIEKGLVSRFNKQVDVDMTDLTEEQLQAYLKGYYEEGNRLLALTIISNKIPERLMKNLEDKNMALEELIEYVGYYDAKDFNIDFDKLPEVVQNSIIYQKGYNLGYYEHKETRRK